MGRTFYRSYTKVLDLTASSDNVVDLTDTAGNGLKCNFISLESSSTGAEGWVLLSPSSLASGTNVNYGIAVGASGVMGVVAQADGGVAQLVMGQGDITSSVAVNVSGDACRVIITYGNAMQSNTLKDAQRPRGI